MQVKHHQQTVSTSQEAASSGSFLQPESRVVVYNTSFTFPSTGTEMLLKDIGDDFTRNPSAFNPSSGVPDVAGNVSNLVFDFGVGGPEGVTKRYWQGVFRGYIYGLKVTTPSVIFRLVYSGNARCFVNTISGGTDQTALNDWTYQVTQDNIRTVDYTYNIDTSNQSFIDYGAISFDFRYWNSSEGAHFIVYVKRTGIDEDFVVVSPSVCCDDYTKIDTTTGIACDSFVIDSIFDWEVTREIDSINIASINMFVPDTSDAFSYSFATDGFGPVRKGALIEIYGGYSSSGETKRFVGNITNAIEVSRDRNGATVTVECEGILSHALDCINFNFPNNATYSLAGYFSDDFLYTEPNGVVRPEAFDQWRLQKVIKSLLLQSGIDPFYLNCYRRYSDSDLTATSFGSDRKQLIDDFDINLSRVSIGSDPKKQAPETFLWEYEFGKDSAYDIIKDILGRYGLFIKEVDCGIDCGKIELVGIKIPIDIKNMPNTFHNSGFGHKHKDAESFLYSYLGINNGICTYNVFGKSFEISFGLGNTSSSIAISHLYGHSGGLPNDISGYIREGQIITSNIVDTSSENEQFYYTNLYNRFGYNPTVVTPFFGITDDIITTDLTYGAHRLQVTNLGYTLLGRVDSIYSYDFGSSPYKAYTTKNDIASLEIDHEIRELRNDIVVLGAPIGSFSFVGEDDVFEEAKQRYIMSRAVDSRSIYDPEYKFYVGKNKKFVIEDPTITTQDRADWLAAHCLFSFSKTSYIVRHSMVCDLGLQLFDAILLDDEKTKTIDKNVYLYVREVKEEWSKNSYTMEVETQSRPWPNSFRQRARISMSDLSTYFNNCPIAFEEMDVPVLPGKSGYDPMSSEDGKFIKFSWTLLIPGMQYMEVFDTRLPNKTPIYTGDKLLTACFICPPHGSSVGTYTCFWDGVYDGVTFSDRYKETHYENAEVPDGNGWFARGQDTLLEDEVDPISIEEEDFDKGKRVTFPLYPVVRVEPVYSEHASVEPRAYLFGEGNSQTHLYEIDHFDLEPRQPIVWDFAEEHMIPSEDFHQYNHYMRTYINPYTLSDASRFQKTELRTEDEIIEGEREDIWTMHFDCVPPFGFDGTHGGTAQTPVTFYRQCDETVGVRVFVDETTPIKRRYRLNKFDIITTVCTVIQDEVEYSATRLQYYLVRGNTVTPIDETFTNNPQQLFACYNIFNCQVSQPFNIKETRIGEKHKDLESWLYLPEAGDRSNTDSILYTWVPCKQDIPTGVFDQRTVIGPYLNVFSVFALPVNNINDIKEEDLYYCIHPSDLMLPMNKHKWGAIHNDYVDAYRVSNRTVGGYITRRGGTDWSLDWALKNSVVRGNSVDYTSVPSQDIIQFKIIDSNGDSIGTRRIFNTILMSLDIEIIDRAGRTYSSCSKKYSDDFFVGRRNEVEIHKDFIPRVMRYSNRYNAYLPTICYVGGTQASLLQQKQNIPFNPNTFARENWVGYNQAGHQGRIPSQHQWSTSGLNHQNYLPISLFGMIESHDSLTPFVTNRPISYETSRKRNLFPVGLPSSYDRYFVRWFSPISFLDFNNYYGSSGISYGVFGNLAYLYNSRVLHAESSFAGIRDLFGLPEEVQDEDATVPSGEAMTSYGIPFYISGGYCCQRILPVGQTINATHPIFEYREREFFYTMYLRNVWAGTVGHNADGFPKSQRAGVSTFVNMSPKFWLACFGRYQNTNTV